MYRAVAQTPRKRNASQMIVAAAKGGAFTSAGPGSSLDVTKKSSLAKTVKDSKLSPKDKRD